LSLQKLFPTSPLEAGFESGLSACCQTFLDDLRAMCGLIDEAGRYGATFRMEEDYRELRSRLARGFREVSEELPATALPAGGFHGCGFEMILVSYTLDGLARGGGRRAIERLSQVWQAVHSAASGEA
jgi:hypothetical protein